MATTLARGPGGCLRGLVAGSVAGCLARWPGGWLGGLSLCISMCLCVFPCVSRNPVEGQKTATGSKGGCRPLGNPV